VAVFHFIPFLADYSEVAKQDKRLESDLQVEAGCILHKLITVCPDVIQSGLRAPRSVMDATSELFDDLDFTKQFKEDRIRRTQGAFMSRSDMEAPIRKWMGFVVDSGADQRVSRILGDLRGEFEYDRRRVENGERPWCFLDVEVVRPGG
jgi:hypothetical protein